MANNPSEVKNHLYLSYQFFFLISENVTDSFAASALFFCLRRLSSVFFFVPRFFWPGKSEATGVLVANELNYRFDNLSTPLMAEFYMDGGFLGVIIGMFLLGMLYRYLFHLSRNFTILVATFYCLFASYQFYFLRGSLMTVTNYLVVAIATYCVLYYFRTRLFTKEPLSITGKIFYRRVYQ